MEVSVSEHYSVVTECPYSRCPHSSYLEIHCDAFVTNALAKLLMDWIVFLHILYHKSFENLSLNSPEQVLCAFKTSIKAVILQLDFS